VLYPRPHFLTLYRTQLFGQDEALGLRMKINGATVMIPTVYNPR
jgi:hypothetical protein